MRINMPMSAHNVSVWILNLFVTKASIHPLSYIGAHEPPKAAKERRTSHSCASGSSMHSRIPNFYLIRQEAMT